MYDSAGFKSILGLRAAVMRRFARGLLQLGNFVVKFIFIFLFCATFDFYKLVHFLNPPPLLPLNQDLDILFGYHLSLPCSEIHSGCSYLKFNYQTP